MNPDVAATAIGLTALGAVLLWSLRYHREQTLRVLSDEAANVLREEVRAHSRRSVVRWVVASIAVLGLGVSFQPAALHLITATTWQNDMAQESANRALSFPGTQDSLQGRARIIIATDSTDPSAHQMNIGDGDMSFEFWLRFDSTVVTQTTTGCNASGYPFTNSEIFLDNDRIGGSEGGYGMGVVDVSGIRVMFSIRDPGGDSYTVCTNAGALVGDNQWHEYTAQWENSTGQMAIYFDGTRHGYTATSSVTGDISMPLATSYTGQNVYFVLGNEKSGTPAGFAFTGEMDELRVSDTLRVGSFASSYTTRSSALAADQWTVSLWHFDDAIGSDSLANDVSIPANPETWTNRLHVTTGVSLVASTAPTGS